MKKTLGRGNSFMTSKNETNSDTEILSNNKKPSVDRVVLSTEAAAKLDSWITRITGTRHGVFLAEGEICRFWSFLGLLPTYFVSAPNIRYVVTPVTPAVLQRKNGKKV
jgi:hypothetical protein